MARAHAHQRQPEGGWEFGIAPLPRARPARFTSVNPTGAVVYKGTKAPEAAGSS